MTDFVSDFIIEDLEVRSDDDGARTVSGLAVPWDQVIDIRGGKESFAKGSIADALDGTPLYFGHNHLMGEAPIGKIISGEDTDKGYRIRASISKTVRGNEVYTLLNDGALKAFSLGFKSLKHRNDKNGVTVREAVKVHEVSVVGIPAYSGATVDEVRSDLTVGATVRVVEPENTPTKETKEMTENTGADLEVRMDTLSRELEVLKTRSADDAEGTSIKFNSWGDFAKRGLAMGEADQADIDTLYRAYADTGEVVADVKNGFAPSWIQRDVAQRVAARPVLEFFDKQALPADGMSVTYPVFGTGTGTVQRQLLEGDTLPLIRVTFGNQSADVLTYGAYSDLSRQVIERTPTSFLNAVINKQKSEYNKATNTAVTTLLLDTPTAYNQGTSIATGASQATAAPWINAALEGVSLIEDNSRASTAGLWVVSSEIFTKLSKVYDSTGRPMFVINGDGSNTIGGLNVLNRTADVAGLRVVVAPGLGATNSFVIASDAITVLEDGAKFLQDSNVTNLTSQFSIYGYMALTKNDPKAITRIVVAA